MAILTKFLPTAIAVVILLLIGIAAGIRQGLIPDFTHSIASQSSTVDSDADAHGDAKPADPHAGHDHGAEAEAAAGGSIVVSQQARRTLNLKVGKVHVAPYSRSVSFSASIVVWPGKTHVNVAAPLTGVVTAVHVSRGETVRSGQQLYTLRLTHQDLVGNQSDFLATLGQLDVEEREIQRVREIAENGVVARRSLLEREYARDKLQAQLQAQRESLLLHGLSEEQVLSIQTDRKLIREVTVFVPTMHADDSLHDDATDGEVPAMAIHEAGYQPRSEFTNTGLVSVVQPPPRSGHDGEHINAQFVVTELIATRGQSVDAGAPLTVLADYETLLVEGRGFQEDSPALAAAARNQDDVQAVFDNAMGEPDVIDGLKIAYISNEIRTDSRALPFYVALQNQIQRSEQIGDGLYVTWRYKPGQRLHLAVPIEKFAAAISVPLDAIAEEGAESYVFVENGNKFDRQPVHILLRDTVKAVIANDGSIYEGQAIALNAAHQLQMALKNQSGGGIDPHAGHNH